MINYSTEKQCRYTFGYANKHIDAEVFNDLFCLHSKMDIDESQYTEDEPEDLFQYCENYVIQHQGVTLLYDSNLDSFCIVDSPVIINRGLGSPCIPNACYIGTKGDYPCFGLPEDWYTPETLESIKEG